MNDDDAATEVEVRVVVPGEVPVLVPGVARALLRIVRAATASSGPHDEIEREAA